MAKESSKLYKNLLMDNIIFAETELERVTVRAATLVLNIHNYTDNFSPLSEALEQNLFLAIENKELSSIKLVQYILKEKTL